MKAVIALGSSKNYTDGSISGISGSLAGKNCTIKSITAVTGGQEVTFEWTADNGTVQTSSMVVKDGSKGAKGNQGKSVASVAFDTNGKLVFALDDGTELTPLDVPSTMVEVSKATGNIIQQKADGMYAPATDLTNYVQKELGKGLSTNDYDATEKAEVAKIKNKVDKVTGKGLSTNDYDNTEKAEVAKVAGKVDKAQGSANAGKILVVGADGNVTLGDDKGSDVVTAWETTPVDTKVPSEKLVKDNLDTITQELSAVMKGTDVWSSSKTYAVGDCCILNNTIYSCIKANSNTTPPNTTYWEETSLSKLNSSLSDTNVNVTNELNSALLFVGSVANKGTVQLANKWSNFSSLYVYVTTNGGFTIPTSSMSVGSGVIFDGMQFHDITEDTLPYWGSNNVLMVKGIY